MVVGSPTIRAEYLSYRCRPTNGLSFTRIVRRFPMKAELSFWDRLIETLFNDVLKPFLRLLLRYTSNQDGEAPDEKAEAIIAAAFPGYHIHLNPKRREKKENG
jgi:hypothetical protein